MNDNTLTRHPIISAALSWFACGVGQIYCGRFTKGLILYSLTFTGMAALPVAVASVGPTVTAVAWTIIAASQAVWIYSLIDAWFAAKRAGSHFVPRDYNRPLVYAILIALYVPFAVAVAFQVRETTVAAYMVTGTPMKPTLQKGDRILVNKLAYRHRLPAVGDIVVLRSPTVPGRTLVRQVAALPGETVADPAGDGDAQAEPLTVPAGHLYMLCENPKDPNDSRRFGPIPAGLLIGRVELVYTPRIKWIGNP